MRGVPAVALILLLLLAVLMLVMPLPLPVLDALIAVNLGMALAVLMIALHARAPLELSVFPALLLVTTLFRLGLSIATSRQILLQRDAGHVVEAFGVLATGGNLLVGGIVFLIVTVVQFIVITRGAERVAEVGARFSLDGMPGRQMSIDGDLRAGVIDAAEARRLRHLVQKESQLFGAMDGAMKFIKGDAIASLIIMAVNLLGGLGVGVLMHGMAAGEALQRYALLSVGDGLLAQLPALLIAIAAGMLVTRVGSEDGHADLPADIARQVSRHPRALLAAAIALCALALLPGFPLWAFLVPAALLLLAARRGPPAPAGAVVVAGGDPDRAGALPVSVTFAPGLVTVAALEAALPHWRARFLAQTGLPMPPLAWAEDDALSAGQLCIRIYQEPVLVLPVPERLVACPPDTAPSPLAAGWRSGLYDAARADLPADAARIGGSERVGALLHAVLCAHAAEFIGVQETRWLMDGMEVRYGELVRELQRQLPVARVAGVLQRLVEEAVSIRDLRAVFEALVEWAPREKDPVVLAEHARVALRRQTMGRLTRSGLSAWLVGEDIEEVLRLSVRQTSAGSYSALGPQTRAAILDVIRRDAGAGPAVLLTALDVRRYLHKLLVRDVPALEAVSFQEMGEEAVLPVCGQLRLDREVADVLA